MSCRSLDGKLDKRCAELERAEKRLSSLAVVRPAYMDEFEILQAELQQLFGVCLERFRCKAAWTCLPMMMFCLPESATATASHHKKLELPFAINSQ